MPASPDGEVSLWPIWISSGTGDARSIVHQDPTQQPVKIVDVALPEIGFSNRGTLMRYGANNGEHAISAIPGTNRFVIVRGQDPGAGASQANVDRIVVIEDFKERLKERVR